jgi:hypothetical protein
VPAPEERATLPDAPDQAATPSAFRSMPPSRDDAGLLATPDDAAAVTAQRIGALERALAADTQ